MGETWRGAGRVGLQLFKIANLFPIAPLLYRKEFQLQIYLSLGEDLPPPPPPTPLPLLLRAAPITHYLLQTFNRSNYFFTFAPPSIFLHLSLSSVPL